MSQLEELLGLAKFTSVLLLVGGQYNRLSDRPVLLGQYKKDTETLRMDSRSLESVRAVRDVWNSLVVDHCDGTTSRFTHIPVCRYRNTLSA